MVDSRWAASRRARLDRSLVMHIWRHYRIGAWLPLLAWLVALAFVVYAIVLNGGFTVALALVFAFVLIMVLAGIHNVRFESGIEDFLYPPSSAIPTGER